MTFVDTTGERWAAHLVEDLRATFGEGRTKPLEWRERQLAQLDLMLTEREDELLDALAADLGKSRFEGWITDVGFVRNDVADLRKRLPQFLKPERVKLPLSFRPARGAIRHEPLGVALVLAPWNYPVQLLLSPMAAAIGAGNCVVGKASEHAPNTSAALARLLPEFVDHDAVRLVEGGVDEATELLAQRWDHVFFTGSTDVGRVVMRAAAEHLTPVTLELGGKSPVIVTGSADLEVAARRIAWGKFVNAGQTCIAPDYVLVDRTVEEPLSDALVAAVRDFFGEDPRRSKDFGRIVSHHHVRRLRGLMLGEGAGISVCGGIVDEGERYIAPTVLRGTSPDAAVMREEIFGPLLPVLGVDGLEDATRFVVDREKPLALYVFGDDLEAETVLSDTSSGGACVNHAVIHAAVPELPFGGVGHSGMGSYHGEDGLRTFSHRRAVLYKPTRPDVKLIYPPYTRVKQRLLRKLL